MTSETARNVKKKLNFQHEPYGTPAFKLGIGPFRILEYKLIVLGNHPRKISQYE